MIKICSMCGSEFEAARNNTKYCSLACREAGRKVSRNNWNRANREYYKKYEQRRKAENAAPV